MWEALLRSKSPWRLLIKRTLESNIVGRKKLGTSEPTSRHFVVKNKVLNIRKKKYCWKIEVAIKVFAKMVLGSPQTLEIYSWKFWLPAEDFSSSFNYGKQLFSFWYFTGDLVWFMNYAHQVKIKRYMCTISSFCIEIEEERNQKLAKLERLLCNFILILCIHTVFTKKCIEIHLAIVYDFKKSICHHIYIGYSVYHSENKHLILMCILKFHQQNFAIWTDFNAKYLDNSLSSSDIENIG